MSTFKTPAASKGIANYGTYGLGTANHTAIAGLFPGRPFTALYAATNDDDSADSFATLDDAMLSFIGQTKTGTAATNPKFQDTTVLPGTFTAVPKLNFSEGDSISLAYKIPNAQAPNTNGVPSSAGTISDLTTMPGPATLGADGKGQPFSGKLLSPAATIKTLGSYMTDAVRGSDTDQATHKWDPQNLSPNQYATPTGPLVYGVDEEEVAAQNPPAEGS